MGAAVVGRGGPGFPFPSSWVRGHPSMASASRARGALVIKQKSRKEETDGEEAVEEQAFGLGCG